MKENLKMKLKKVILFRFVGSLLLAFSNAGYSQVQIYRGAVSVAETKVWLLELPSLRRVASDKTFPRDSVCFYLSHAPQEEVSETMSDFEVIELAQRNLKSVITPYSIAKESFVNQHFNELAFQIPATLIGGTALTVTWLSLQSLLGIDLTSLVEPDAALHAVEVFGAAWAYAVPHVAFVEADVMKWKALERTYSQLKNQTARWTHLHNQDQSDEILVTEWLIDKLYRYSYEHPLARCPITLEPYLKSPPISHNLK